MRGYLLSVGKDYSYAWSCSLHKGGTSFWMGLIFKNSKDSFSCFCWLYFNRCLTFFFLYQLPSSALCMVFETILSNIYEILSINPSANVFVFGDFNVHHKDWLTSFDRTDRHGELCYIFSIDSSFTPIENFWSCCLSFHWFSFKLKKGCPFSLHNLWLFQCPTRRLVWAHCYCRKNRLFDTNYTLSYLKKASLIKYLMFFE